MERHGSGRARSAWTGALMGIGLGLSVITGVAGLPAPASAAMLEDGNGGASAFESATSGFAVINNNQDRNEPTLFKVYHKDHRVLASIPGGMLDRLWLLGASVASGPFGTGEQLGQAGLEWRRRGDVLDLFEPELRYSSDSKPTLSEGVRRVFTDRHIASVPILADSPDGGVLVDLTGFLSESMPDLVGSFFGSVNASVLRVERVKAFAQNVELAVSVPIRLPFRAWWMPVQDGQMQTLHFSFSALADSPSFEQRAADPRVGYWVHARRDMGRREPLGTDFVRTIERWNLRKADPDAPLSPPAEPIVFYIEKTVPHAYRVHVRRGVEAWNEAFRAIGIENAIEVRQQTETQYANIDPEDVRYNFIRWVPTGFGYAIALHRTDPRTGEILDADVVIDDAWINAWANELPLLTQTSARARLEAMGRHHPELEGVVHQLTKRAGARGLIAPELDVASLREQPERAASLSPRQRGDLLRRMLQEAEPGVLSPRQNTLCRCAFTERLGHSVAMARLCYMIDPALHKGADGEKGFLIDGVPEDLIAHNLVALVAHEVGHVLGLRHNFAGSTWKPASAIDQYTDPAQEPPATSVMDYIGTFIAEPGQQQGMYNMVRVGKYDRWAIAYGYMEGDEEALKAHLAKSVLPEHRYMTDEDVYSVDPTAMRYDFGSDPVEGRKRELRRIDYLRGRLVDRLEQEGENWTKLNAAFNTLWVQELFALWDTTGWVGGTYLSRDFNTPNARLPRQNVEASRQRGVLDLLIDRLFSEHSLPLDRDLVNRLQTVTWYDSNFNTFIWGGSGDVDLLGRMSRMQYAVLTDLLFWCTPRLANQELRTDPSEDALTVPELHKRLTDAIWSEFGAAPPRQARHTNLSPKVSAMRRGVQREHVEQLVDLAYRFRSMPPTLQSAQLVAIDQLREIRERLARWAPNGRAVAGLDDYTRVHITELLRLIDATLAAQVTREP